MEASNEKAAPGLTSSNHFVPLEQANRNQMVQSPDVQMVSCHPNFSVPDDPVVLGKPVEKFIRKRVLFLTKWRQRNMRGETRALPYQRFL